MGTTWSLRSEGAGEAHRRLIQDHLDQREAQFSHWRDGSPLSRFNAHASTGWFEVPAVIVQAIEVMHRIAGETDAVLDPTCAPLVDAWGFGRRKPGSSPPPPPDDATLASLRARCGWHLLGWRNQTPALRKHRPDVRLNLASIVEGFVLDELRPRLIQAGLTHFLFELGGEVLAQGQAPDGGPWRIGIQDPGRPKGEPIQTLILTDACAATSGSYREQRQLDGKTVSHLIDPRHGRPVQHRAQSVTVVDASAVRADGLATALMILGPEEGRVKAATLGINAFWVVASS
jgi:thiamine biosynthesis lipoprotein